MEESHAGPGAEIISDESKTGPAPDNIYAHTNLAATYIMMGREKEARAAAAEILRINPKFSFVILQRSFHIRINRKRINTLTPCVRLG